MIQFIIMHHSGENYEVHNPIEEVSQNVLLLVLNSSITNPTETINRDHPQIFKYTFISAL